MRRLLGSLAAGLFLTVATFAQTAAPVRFSVLVNGVQVGSEVVTVSRTPSGWIISSSGRQGPPVDLINTRFSVTYGGDWQPRDLIVDGVRAGKSLSLSSTFTGTTAASTVVENGKTSSMTVAVSPKTVALPNNFYAAYEALAARLEGAAVGATLPIFVVPQVEVTATVDAVTERRIMATRGSETIRQVDLTLASASGAIPIQLWIDSHNRLARLAMPSAAIVVVRDDLSSVLTREEAVSRAGDTHVFIPAEAFNLAATMSAGAVKSRKPAVVLVPASGGSGDRDLTLDGVPVFGQLAGGLADAGYIVVRYDKRGVGQSGGRTESATLAEYADDVNHVVDWTRRQNTVDPERIAVIGYAEGGAVALTAAAKNPAIRAVGLVAVPGSTGREAVMDQQQRALAGTTLTDPDKRAKILLEEHLIEAVITGRGWEAIPPSLREGADTPMFRSWLLFNPAAAIAKVRRPILILQGALDTDVPPNSADRLEAFGRGRAGRPATDTQKRVLSGVTHQLTIRGDKIVSSNVTTAIAGWLDAVLAPRK